MIIKKELMGFEFGHQMPSLQNQNASKNKASLKRGSESPQSRNISRYAEKKEGAIDHGRRKLIAGLLATGVTAVVGGKAIEAAKDIMASLDNSRKKTDTIPVPEAKFDQLEQEEESYIPEEDLTGEEINQIRNILDYDSKIILTMEKHILLERSWKNNYEDHALYKREFEKSYAQMDKYKKELGAYFSQCGVPEEFIYLSIPESYSKSRAVSHKGAKGPYQFMKDTAIEYGLKIDKHVDERIDFIKSGKACARFLSKLFKELGDWNLALYAYNGGFARRYAKEARAKNEMPSEEGFLKYMEKKTEAIRQEMKAQDHTIYSAVKGDTLSGIAKKHSINYDKLRQFNGIRDPRGLKINQKIKIPLSTENRERIYNKKVSGILENINYAPKCNAAFQIAKEKNNTKKDA